MHGIAQPVAGNPKTHKTWHRPSPLSFSVISLDSYSFDSTRTQSPYSLHLQGAWDELLRMRQGGTYWLACDRQDDAMALCLQALAGMSAQDSAILVCPADIQAGLLRALPAESGPAQCHLFTYETAHAGQALAALADDLGRGVRVRDSLLLIVAESRHWQAMGDRSLQDWLARCAGWLAGQGCAAVVLSHGDASPSLCARLLPLNHALSGLVHVQARPGRTLYGLRYWRNSLDVAASRLFTLQSRPDGLALSELADTPRAGRNDDGVFLMQAAAMEGAPQLSDQHELFDDAQSLSERALLAQAASVVFCLTGPGQVADLARRLHALRTRRGNALKLLVREMVPCLRQQDERLLLACGANLVVPAGTALARFLTMLAGLPGQHLQHEPVDDPEPLIRALQPPQIGGVVQAGVFADHVAALLDNPHVDGAGGALVILETVPGLHVRQAMGQLRLRRDGDIACLAGQRLYLFLYGCQASMVQTALGNVFRLPHQTLFARHDVVTTRDRMKVAIASLSDTGPQVDAAMPGGASLPDASALVAAPAPGGAGAAVAPSSALMPRPAGLWWQEAQP
jgi:cellulose biosynthesis protein BcsE